MGRDHYFVRGEVVEFPDHGERLTPEVIEEAARMLSGWSRLSPDQHDVDREAAWAQMDEIDRIIEEAAEVCGHCPVCQTESG